MHFTAPFSGCHDLAAAVFRVAFAFCPAVAFPRVDQPDPLAAHDGAQGGGVGDELGASAPLRNAGALAQLGTLQALAPKMLQLTPNAATAIYFDTRTGAILDVRQE